MAQGERTGETSGAAPPARPTDLSKRSWRGVLTRTVSEFRQDDLTLLAAALTYYGVLSLFPALLVLVSILGLLGASATQPLVDTSRRWRPARRATSSRTRSATCRARPPPRASPS
jgi:membrane protein